MTPIVTKNTIPPKCQLDSAQFLLHFYNSNTHSRKVISDYCHGKLPLPTPCLLRYIKTHNQEIIDSSLEITTLFDQSIQSSQKFYDLLEKSAKLPLSQYKKTFESRIQQYGQALIDQLYLTRQHIKMLRIKHPEIQLSTPEHDDLSAQRVYSYIWKIPPIRKLYALVSLWAYKHHNKILTVYYGVMVLAITLSWYLGFIALGHVGYQSNLAFFASAITAIITMLAFLSFHPVVDFNNYDMDGRNVLARIYRKYVNSLRKNNVQEPQLNPLTA